MKPSEPYAREIVADGLAPTAPGESHAHREYNCAGSAASHAKLGPLLRRDKPADDCLGKAAPAPDTNSRTNVLWWISLVLLLYVLSVGPVVKLEFAEKIPKDTVEMIYAPLVWLCDTPVGDKLVRPGLIWYGKTIWRWELPIK